MRHHSPVQSEYSYRFLPHFLSFFFVLALVVNSTPFAAGQTVKGGREPLSHDKIPTTTNAQPESPALIVVPNGTAVVTSSGSDGATVKVVDVSQFGTLWANPANLAPNYISTPAQMFTLSSWTTAQFNNSSGGPQAVRTLAIKSDGTTIYVGASGYVGASKTPTIWRIGPSSATPVPLANLPSYVANPAIRRGIGGLDLDEVHNTVFASDLADGIIYRRDATTGANLGSFDPLTPYSIGDTNLPPYGERVIAVAYNKVENRLYYAIWGHNVVAATGTNSVRSVGLDAITGAFIPATDQLEFTLPGSVAPVADIEFNTACTKMLLAEENLIESSGAITLGAHNARSLEYQGSAGTWAIDPTVYDVGTLKYNIGGFSNRKNSRGGIAWAYATYNVLTGTITGNENFVMFTGDALRLDTVSVYGLQYSPATGGGAAGGVTSNSLIADLDYDVDSQDKFTYGDVDIRRSLTTTAAEVSVTGRVTGGNGMGMSGVSIVMTGSDGQSRTAYTSPFGYYRFDNVQVGDTYVMTPSAKRTRFEPQIISVQDEMNDVNFTPN